MISIWENKLQKVLNMPEQVQTKDRSALIDYLKALAIILVVMNHSMDSAGSSSIGYFYIIRMAVPIFVLISGFNFTSSIERMSSIDDWCRWDRFKQKMIQYLRPMIIVFGLWVVLQIFRNGFDVLTILKAFVLQSYGQGAYYFWIIVQLYLLFPLVYYIVASEIALRLLLRL